MPRAGNLPYIDSDRSKSNVVFQCTRHLDLCQNNSFPESFWTWVKALMRLSQDGLINRNCHDMPNVILKMLNLWKMEIRASIVALAFPNIYSRFSLDWGWNVLTGSTGRKNPSNWTLGYSGRSASSNPLSVSDSPNTYTIRQVGNACTCFIQKNLYRQVLWNAGASHKLHHQKKDRNNVLMLPSTATHLSCGYIYFLYTSNTMKAQ